MKTILETSRQVADFLGKKVPGDLTEQQITNAFEDAHNWVPSEQWLRSSLKNELEEAGIKRWRSRECQVKFLRFLECDSGNISHAAAIYEYEVTLPTPLSEKLNGHWKDELEGG